MIRKPTMANIEFHLKRQSTVKPLIARQLTFNRFKDNLDQRKLFLQRETLKSQRNFSNILSRMSNVCYNMITRYNGDQIIMNNLKQIALNQSKRLSVHMKRLARVNTALNYQHRDTYAVPLNRSNDTIEEFERYKKENESSFIESSERYNSDISNEISYSDLTIVKHDNKQYNKDANELEEFFRKNQKLEKLKGEILLSDQRKKYHIHKTFEKRKEYNQKHFFRNESNFIEYKPYSRYHKGNLYFNKSYKNIKLQIYTKPSLNKQNKKQLNKTQNNNITTNNLNITNEFINSKTKPNLIHKTFIKSNAFSSNSPSQTSATTTKANTSSHKPQIRLIKTAFFEKGANMYSHSRNKSTSPFKYNKKQFDKLSNVYTEACNRSRNISCDIYNGLTEHEEMKQKFVKFSKEKNDFDLNKIVDELKLNKHKKSKSECLMEEDIIRKNAMKVAKMLPKDNHDLLWQMVNELLYEQKTLHKQFEDESNLSKKLFQIKQKKEFQKVCDQTMILKKNYSLGNTVEPKNELRKIKKILQDINGNLNTSHNFQKVWLKLKVMKDIKPLLYNNRIFKGKKSKDKKLFKFYED